MNFLLADLSDDLIQIFSKGFIESPLKFILSIIIIVIVIIMIIITPVFIYYRNKKILSIALKERYKNLVKKFEITNEEEEIIKKLSVFLKNSDKKYLLLVNPNIFYTALDYLKKTEDIKDSLIEPLIVKLGFNKVSPYSIIKTTHDLPEGMPVYAVINSNLKINGKVLRSENYLKIVTITDFLNIDNDIPAVIFTYNHSGIYSFQTKFIKNEQKILYFEHSNKFKLYQRRKFFRKKLNLPVMVNKSHEEDKFISLMMHDLSGNGASLDNLDLNLRLGDDLKICFPDANENNLCLDAYVIRTTKNKSKIYVKFSHLKPIIQDKIIRLVNVKK